jgi:hypothetical protein
MSLSLYMVFSNFYVFYVSMWLFEILRLTVLVIIQQSHYLRIHLLVGIAVNVN